MADGPPTSQEAKPFGVREDLSVDFGGTFEFRDADLPGVISPNAPFRGLYAAVVQDRGPPRPLCNTCVPARVILWVTKAQFECLPYNVPTARDPDANARSL